MPLMTCRVKVIALDGTVMQAIALLDSAALTSLILERLAKRLRLLLHCSNLKIIGVAGIGIRPRGGVNFKVGRVKNGVRQMRQKPLSSQDHFQPIHSSCFPGYQVETLVRSGVCGSRLWNSGTGGHTAWRKGL